MKTNKEISIVVPVLNEQGTIHELVARIDRTLKGNYTYEIIFVDDYSKDQTAHIIQTLQKNYPIVYLHKQGVQGKAYALLQGFAKAQYDVIAMIDADLQYPPEAIPELMQQVDNGSDIVIAERRNYPNALRKVVSVVFQYFFADLLHGLPFDVQSGLKLFKKEIIERVTLHPFPWTFDLEFLVAARSAGYNISGIEIQFDPRKTGHSKVNILKTSLQIGLSAFLVKIKPAAIIPFHENKRRLVGPGFHYKNIEFIHFSNLNVGESAIKTLMGHQALGLIIFIALIAAGMVINWTMTTIVLIGIMTVLYFIDLLFNFYLIYRSFTRAPELQVMTEELAALTDWPRYTILCPLYREWAVVPQFVKAIEKLDYPKDKLQVLLILEQDDAETRTHVQQLDLPAYFQVVIVPNSLPKTKPKACNYGLRFADGDYAVIYDAEDMPDPKQLKKAIVAFMRAPDNVACIQAKLNYYNKSQNILTRLFTAEYSLWFDLILTGLQSLHAPIPLGGTSNHFKIDKLREVKAWDSFNVTEDCDLGIRLAKHGYETAIMDSITLEEANSDFANWINQRSRWIKGYMQTYLVHMRNPKMLFQKGYRSHFFAFQLVVGGKILSLFINPLMWTTTILYFTLRATAGPVIEELFPGTIFYLAVCSLIAGNFLYLYYYMIGCAKRKHYDLIKYVYLVPFYWIVMSIAAWKGLIQLIFNPHYWPKTKHGLHIKTLDVAYQTPKEDIGSNQLAFYLKAAIEKGKIAVNSVGVLVTAGVVANVLNYLYSAYLSRRLSLEDFGLISLISSFLFLTVIPLDSLYSTIIYRTGYFYGKYKVPFEDFWLKIRKTTFVISVIIFVFWIIAIPVLKEFFHVHTVLPFVLFAPVWILNTLMTVDLGYLTGSHSFIVLALITASIPLIKLLSAIAILYTPFTDYIYAAIPVSILGGTAIAYFFARSRADKKADSHDKKLLKFPYPYFYSAVLLKFSTVAYITIDLLLAKHFLTPVDAGKYALIALIGKMIFFMGSLFNQFIIPFLTKEFGEKKKASQSFPIILVASTLSSAIAYIIVGVFGSITGPFLFGEKVNGVVGLLPVFGAGMLAFSIASSIIAYHQVRKNYIFPLATFVLAAVQIGLTAIFHQTIEQFVLIMALIGVLNLVVIILLHIFSSFSVAISLNIADFINLFVPLPSELNKTKEYFNILIFNWRDTQHVWTGGAEVYIHEISRRLVKQGHNVTVFCGNDNKSKRYETIDGVHIIRRGGFFTVYVWAFLYYMLKLRGKFDVIIDSENGIPFFTPLYVFKPIIGLVHHVHQEVFRANLPWPLASIACFLEGTLMPLVYRNVQMITVSQSSKQAMERIGLGKKLPIQVIYPGVNLVQFKPGNKSSYPSILYLGRLKPYKSIDVLLKALKSIIKQHPNLHVTIAGFGESRGDLVKLARKLRIMPWITFAGRVTDEEKIRLLQEAWVFVQPSRMEGWGISALEAQACGTPVVAADVPGLRDCVQNEVTGYLVRHGDSAGFAEKIKYLLRDHNHREQFNIHALLWVSQYTWEKSAEKLETVMKGQI